MQWVYVLLIFTALLHSFLCAKNSKEKKGPPKKGLPKKVNVIEVTSKALLANLSPGKTKTPGGTDVLKKYATMKRRGGDELTILKRYRSTDKSPHIDTMRRAATRLLTPHDERNLKRRLGATKNCGCVQNHGFGTHVDRSMRQYQDLEEDDSGRSLFFSAKILQQEQDIR